MIRHKLAAMIVPLAVAFCQAAVQSTFYVSPTGTGDYSQASPGSLSGIQAKVRTVNTTMTGDIVVYLKGGVYTLTAPLNFGPSDGGSGSNYVRFVNAPGEKPIISGGRPVTGWSAHSGNIWKASVPGVITKIRNMFVNGVRANMAKGRNVWGQGGWGTGAFANTYDGIKFTPSQVALYKNPSLMELRQVIHFGYGENTYCVREIASDAGYTVFKMQQPAFSISQSGPELQLRPGFTENVQCDWSGSIDGNGCAPGACGSTPWWEQNEGFDLYSAYELLDSAGEFYFDAPASMLYYIPRPGENLASSDVQVALVEGLLNIKGTNLTNHVHNTQFWGITFEYSDWQLVNQQGSYSAIQGGVGGTVLYQWGGVPPTWCFPQAWTDEMETEHGAYSTSLPAAINIESADNIDFQWNVIKHTGASGIAMKNDVLTSNIIGNYIHDVGACGISVGRRGDAWIGDSSAARCEEYGPTREGQCKNIRVWNNYIAQTSKQFGGACPIRVHNEVAVDVSHNEIYDCPYTALGMGWGYTAIQNSLMKDCKINYNKIHRFMTRFGDGGGIYIEGPQVSNCEMVENYIYDNPRELQVLSPYIYLDNGTKGWTVKHNVMIYDRSSSEIWPIGGIEEPQLVNAMINNDTQDKSVMDSAGLQSCYRTIGAEPTAPLQGDVTCGVTAVSPPAQIALAAVKPAAPKVRFFDLRGRLITTSDRMSNLLRGHTRPMGAGIVIVKKEFAAGQGGRTAIAVVR